MPGRGETLRVEDGSRGREIGRGFAKETDRCGGTGGKKKGGMHVGWGGVKVDYTQLYFLNKQNKAKNVI